MPKTTMMRVIAESKWPLVNTVAAGGTSAVSAVQEWKLADYIQGATLVLIVVQVAYTIWKFQNEREKERKAEEMNFPTVDPAMLGRPVKPNFWSRMKSFFGWRNE